MKAVSDRVSKSCHAGMAYRFKKESEEGVGVSLNSRHNWTVYYAGMPITPLDDAPQHSYCKFINNFPGIAELMPIVKTGIADPNQFDPNNKYCTYQESSIYSFLQNATHNYAIAPDKIMQLYLHER